MLQSECFQRVEKLKRWPFESCYRPQEQPKRKLSFPNLDAYNPYKKDILGIPCLFLPMSFLGIGLPEPRTVLRTNEEERLFFIPRQYAYRVYQHDRSGTTALYIFFLFYKFWHLSINVFSEFFSFTI